MTKAFGVELEYICDWRVIEPGLKEVSKLSGAPFYNEFLGSWSKERVSRRRPLSDQDLFTSWVLKKELSASCEINTPILRKISDLRKFFTCLHQSFSDDPKMMISKDCGLHVHVGVPRIPRMNTVIFFRTLSCCEKFLFSLVPGFRKKSGWCDPLKSYLVGTDYQKARSLQELSLSFGKGSSFVVTNFGTIECRMAHSSIKTEDICCWTWLVLKVVDLALKNCTSSNLIFPKTREMFLETFSPPAYFLSWLGARKAALNEIERIF